MTKIVLNYVFYAKTFLINIFSRDWFYRASRSLYSTCVVASNSKVLTTLDILKYSFYLLVYSYLPLLF